MGDIMVPSSQEAPPTLGTAVVPSASASTPAGKDLYTVASVPTDRSASATSRVFSSSASMVMPLSDRASLDGHSLASVLSQGDISEDCASGAVHHAYQHMFMQIPVRIIFGAKASPGLVQVYWFAVNKDL